MLGKMLTPLWNILNGHKTYGGIVATLVLVAMHLVAPDGTMGQQLAALLEIIKAKTGEDPAVTATEIGALIGVIHKIYKKFKGETV